MLIAAGNFPLFVNILFQPTQGQISTEKQQFLHHIDFLLPGLRRHGGETNRRLADCSHECTNLAEAAG
uniref:Uncharacterized protein n=1 Tax=Anguilla anguilla TaxID=7936 RepID=A0A0E9QEK5_ANGAN